jgi:branched-chain amino acid transport system ATP-binding protein
MLQVSELETGYGQKQVLFGPSLEIRSGEIVALIGPNGAGKSTVLKAVCGLIPVWKGEVRFEGARLNGSTPAKNVSRGITLCPQGNRVFGSLTVLENLEVGGYQLSRKELAGRLDEVFKLFLVLKDRKRQSAGKLSGGEQQMLALARALVPRPKLLLLDEPSLGLSPSLVGTIFQKVVEISRQTGTAILVVEQKVRDVLRIAQRAYGLRLGKIVIEGSSEHILAGDNLKSLFLC